MKKYPVEGEKEDTQAAEQYAREQKTKFLFHIAPSCMCLGASIPFHQSQHLLRRLESQILQPLMSGFKTCSEPLQPTASSSLENAELIPSVSESGSSSNYPVCHSDNMTFST